MLLQVLALIGICLTMLSIYVTITKIVYGNSIKKSIVICEKYTLAWAKCSVKVSK